MSVQIRTWQSVQDEVLRRIRERRWKPGDTIPGEAELSEEFGCARTTVNRALRSLAEAGLLDRRRKAGTRVALDPVRKATLEIPIIRHEIESRGRAYGYGLVLREFRLPTPDAQARMRIGAGQHLLYILAVHLADGVPHVFERRWINTAVVPEAAEQAFETQSANEWLVRNIPFEAGDIALSAAMADAEEAAILACPPGAALFVIERSTWRQAGMITQVRLAFAPGYRLRASF